MKKDALNSQVQILFPKEKIADFCRKHHIKKSKESLNANAGFSAFWLTADC